MSDIAADLGILSAQERDLVFARFDTDVAWRLGGTLRQAALDAGAALTIEIRAGRQILFHAPTPGTAAINADWVRRKGNTAAHFGRSSYAIGLALQRDRASIEDKYGLSGAEFATQGGGFPVRLAAAAGAAPLLVGSIAVSGLPQRQDHVFVATTLARFLDLPLVALTD
ncbi:heme-degrading domain-containing protein [Robbsia sp. Bb-Pol-6]|uniref:Heme-degrading domain-containing protein n=1 Tax=Robbsia betulipollinis TaxID=2981849 RepID=A0ABT3ZHB1_9BURK|nr:heme-degrading domain-containing protein [Robbsia betulipollinis]MCY0385913.1 heme-degrading domain-containing protein [Robbsia betulipollinis]